MVTCPDDAVFWYEELQLVRLWTVNCCACLHDPHRMRNEWHWGFEYGIRVNVVHAFIE